MESTPRKESGVSGDVFCNPTTSKLRSGVVSFLDCLIQRSLFQKAGIAELVRVTNRSHVGFPQVNLTYSDERSHLV
ncbi:MAG: hypothetical protein AB1589_10810 [Cyanobacteriota bacterium]